jgi:hypothetical protein
MLIQMQGEQQHHSCKMLWGRINQSSLATEQLANHYIQHETLQHIETRVEAKAVADKPKKDSNNPANEDQRLADLITASKSESCCWCRQGDLEGEPIGAINIKSNMACCMRPVTQSGCKLGSSFICMTPQCR